MKEKFILNPMTKLLIVLFLGATLFQQMDNKYSLIIVLIFSFFYFLHGKPLTAIRTSLVYILISLIVNAQDYSQLHVVFKMFLSFILIIKIFYLPFMAGKFFIVTSDVSSVISSMDMLRIPMAFSIPIAVMFRFFPSFKEEHENIKMAMKIRGITIKSPLNYIENVTIPLLILSSNVTDNIAKAAETKCIADPVKKVRYKKVRFGLVDICFVLMIVAVQVIGTL